MTVLVSYTLNREAADVELEFYGPDLEPLGSLTGQPVDAGANWSDVETLTGVQYDANGDLVGPIYCVAFATETADDGELNRDLQPKPALQKGATYTVLPPAFNFYGDGEHSSDFQNYCDQIRQWQESPQGEQPAYNAEMASAPPSAQALYERWETQYDPGEPSDAVIAYIGHGGIRPADQEDWPDLPPDPEPPVYSYLSLNGIRDGKHELRGGRAADNPQNHQQNDIYYISNLPDEAFSRARLITFIACHSAHHTALRDDWDDLKDCWEADPSLCGCAVHAALAKGAACVLGFQRKAHAPHALVWAKNLWRDLSRQEQAWTLGQALAAADDLLRVQTAELDPVLRAEILSRIIDDRFIGGSSPGDELNTIVRPGRWAD